MKKYFLISGLIHALFYFSLSNDVRPTPKKETFDVDFKLKDEVKNENVKVENSNEQPVQQLEKLSAPKEKFIENDKLVSNKKVETHNIGKFNNSVAKETRSNKKIGENIKKGKMPAIASTFDSSVKIIERKPASYGVPAYEYIEDLDVGLETLLNTKETVFYDYYKSLRQKINSQWNPIIRQKLSHILKDKNLAETAKNQTTKCLVTMDKMGRVLLVQIIGKSEIRSLDEAAVQAFRLASPLPKPPKDLSDDEQHYLIRWDFIIDN